MPQNVRMQMLSLMEKSMAFLARRQTGSQPKSAIAGESGEQAAYFHLRRLGYAVVATRWRTARLRGEVDLIAWEGETLCFVEVKTRGVRGLVEAAMAVDEDKQENLRRMARAYVAQLPAARVKMEAVPIRFDVVSIYLDSLPEGIELRRGAMR